MRCAHSRPVARPLRAFSTTSTSSTTNTINALNGTRFAENHRPRDAHHRRASERTAAPVEPLRYRTRETRGHEHGPRKRPAEQAEMSALVDARDWPAALALAKKLTSTSLASQAQTLRIYIEGLLASRQGAEASAWIGHFLRANPDKFSATSVMRALVRAGRVDDALFLFKRMREKDHVSGSVLARGFLQDGRLDELIKLLLEMERFQPLPSTSLYRQLLSALLAREKFTDAKRFVEASTNADALARCADLLARLGIDDAAMKGVRRLAHVGTADGLETRRVVGTLVALSQQGKVDEIEKLIDEIPAHDTPTLADARAVLLDSYIKERRFSKARELLSATCAFYTLWLLQASLKAHVALGDVRAAADLLEQATVKYGVEPDAVAYNTVLSGWVRLRRTKEAEACLEAMQQRGVKPTYVSFVSLLRGFAEEGNLEKAEAVLAAMKQQGLQPTAIVWSAFLSLLARTDLSAARERLRALEADGFPPSPELYNAVIARLALHDIAAAVEMKNRLVRGPHKPTEITYNCLVNAALRSGDVPGADALCNEMQGLGLKPDLLMCSEMARAWRNEGNASMADMWEKKAAAWGVPIAKGSNDPPAPAVLHLRKALTAIVEGKLEEARASVRALWRTGTSKVDDFIVLAKRMANKGHYADLRWLMAEASEAGYGKPASLWNAHLAALARANKPTEFAGVRREMDMEGVLPDAETLALEVSMLARTNRLAEAEELFLAMPQRGIVPSTLTCNRLLQAYARSGNVKKASWLMERLADFGVSPDPHTYYELVRAHVVAGDVQRAVRLVDEKHDALPSSAFVLLIKELETAKDPDQQVIARLRQYMHEARKTAHSTQNLSYSTLRHLLN